MINVRNKYIIIYIGGSHNYVIYKRIGDFENSKVTKLLLKILWWIFKDQCTIKYNNWKKTNEE